MEVFLLQLVISSIMAAAFAPDVETPEAASLEDVDVPVVNQGMHFAVIFGSFLLKAANVIWYGNLGTEAVRTSAGK